jgi:SAM-dependent methyltransferase
MLSSGPWRRSAGSSVGATKFKKGYPKGDKDLVLPAAYYNDVYSRSLHQKIKYYLPWSKLGSRSVVWYPALMLAEPPILDIGCGAGHFAAMCRDFNVAYSAGIDYSSSAIKLARMHAPRAHFITSNAGSQAAMIKGNSYKTAVFLEVLEHVYEDLDMIRKIPKGRVVVGSVPSFHTYGHCRWFGHAGEVKQRYKNVLDLKSVIVECAQGSDNRWFIFKGVRP